MNPFDIDCSSNRNGGPGGSNASGHDKRVDPFETPPDYRILTFSGASGAGKTVIVNGLMTRFPEFERAISCTTRPQRDTDPPGEYACLSDEEFDRYERQQAFLWIVAYAGYRYGTLARTANDAIESKYPRIMTLTPDKADLIRARYPLRVLSFLVTPPPEDVLRERLLSRGDSPEQIERRLRKNRQWEEEQLTPCPPYISIPNLGTPEEAVERVVAELRRRHVIA